MSASALAFVYDRCLTANRSVLDLRLAVCTEYLAERGWTVGGRFVDFGDHALTDVHRPAFDEMLRAMVEASGRERVCLLHDWGRLSHTAGDRRGLASAVLGVGAWLSTVDGDSVGPGALPTGRVTAAPQVVRR
ncbi:recombinase family protein [Streptomyces griseoluteus]|uniref:recombinase family protein n=1 Tax=Streptomyces griseoluteus TaxID=29306 RepID=UPI0036909D0B